MRGSKRNTMKNCNVSHSKCDGLYVDYGGLMTIDGNATAIHHNGTNCYHYGLHACSSIHLVSPLTKEMISTNNGGGGNLGGDGTIANINSKGIIKSIQEAEPEEQNDVGPLDTDEDYYAPRLRF